MFTVKDAGGADCRVGMRLMNDLRRWPTEVVRGLGYDPASVAAAWRAYLAGRIAESEAYANELDTWLWDVRRKVSNPQGYADREREKEAAVARLELLRAELADAGVVTERQFGDGSAVVRVAGVRLTVGRAGRDGRAVYAMDDWGRADELVASGVLRREVWRGNGTAGHDTYVLVAE